MNKTQVVTGKKEVVFVIHLSVNNIFNNITAATQKAKISYKYQKGFKMSKELLLQHFGKTSLLSGMPDDFSDYMIPAAVYFHATGPWGILCLQEIKTSRYLLRHFLFSLTESISFFIEDGNSKLQSLLTINGHFDFEIKGKEKISLKEKEYLLFITANQSSLTTVHTGDSSILNAHYSPGLYQSLVPYFVGLKEDLRKGTKKPHYLIRNRNTIRNSVHEVIKAIWEEKYIPALQVKHIELKLETSLFTMLAQSYHGEAPVYISPTEKKFAEEAETIILQNLKLHLTPEEIAQQLNCSASWLRKAFRKVHGIPMFQFLRRSRMLYAQEQLLDGASLKAVSIELGMNPSNFPKEFKSFFGYTVTSLKKGNY